MARNRTNKNKDLKKTFIPSNSYSYANVEQFLKIDYNTNLRNVHKNSRTGQAIIFLDKIQNRKLIRTCETLQLSIIITTPIK